MSGLASRRRNRMAEPQGAVEAHRLPFPRPSRGCVSTFDIYTEWGRSLRTARNPDSASSSATMPRPQSPMRKTH